MAAPDPPTADFDAALDEVLDRVRRGQRPDLTKVAEERPELAAQLRDLLPLLLALEAAPVQTPEATRLGDYLVGKEVGRGAMGVVYEATHAALGKRVALKVLNAAAAGKQDRFLREARLAAGLHHSNIVPVFDVGTANGTAYYAMEFIDGVTLATALPTLTRFIPAEIPKTVTLAGRPADETDFYTDPPPKPARPGLPPRLAAGYIAQAAEALGYAHGRGIVHRDVKPGNLLLDAAGTVWVADFGLAFHRDDATITADGAILGTPRYMAPEQAGGGSKDVDARADVYALGVTLYELLTGADPFPGQNIADVLRMAAEYTPPTPRTVDRRIPRDLDTVVQKAMAKRPADRYGDGSALAADLRRFLAGEPVTARRISVFGRAWRWCKRNRAVAALLGAVATLLILLAVGSVAAAVRLDGALGRAVTAEEIAVGREADAKLEAARGHRLSRRPGQRFAALDDLRGALELARRVGKPDAWYAGARSEAFNILALPDLSADPLPVDWTAEDQLYDADESFTKVVVLRKDGRVVLRSLADGSESAPLPLPAGPKHAVQFGPHGLIVVWGSDPFGMQIYDAAAPDRGPVLTVAEDVNSVAFAPDGSEVYVISGDRARGYAMPGGAAVADFRLPPGTPGGMTIARHPSAPVVAVSGYNGVELLLLHARTGEVLQRTTPPFKSRGLSGPAFTPDGRRLLVGEGNAPVVAVYHFDAAERRATFDRMLTTQVGGGIQLCAGPDSRTVLARGWSQTASLVDLDAGREVVHDSTTSSPATQLRFAPTPGRAGPVKTAAGKLAAWRADAGFACQFIPLPKVSPSGPPAFSPDGRLVWVRLLEGIAAVDMVHGRMVQRLATEPPSGDADPEPQDDLATLATDTAGNLFTQGRLGLFRWPFRREGTTYTIGPPEPTGIPPGVHQPAMNGDGRVTATSMYNGYGMQRVIGGWYAVRGRKNSVRVDETESAFSANVTPDGKFVLFSLSRGTTRIYDTESNLLIATLPGGCPNQGIAPDGRHLVIGNGDTNALHAVGTWDRVRDLGPGDFHAFSPDSRYALFRRGTGRYRLVRAADAAVLLEWEDPDLLSAAAAFTPDGSRIITLAKDGLRVWDLAVLRGGLANLDLDYDAPPSPPAPPPAKTPATVTVRGLGRLTADDAPVPNFALLASSPTTAAGFSARGRAFAAVGFFDAALRDYDRALKIDPKQAPAATARAFELTRRADWPAAETALTAALLLTPGDPELLFRRAWARRERGNPAGAAADVSSLLDVPNLDRETKPTAYWLRSELVEKLGRKDAAAADRTAAGADFGRHLNNFAWKYATRPAEERVPAAAVWAAERAVADANTPTHYNTLGTAYLRAGRPADARAAFERSLATVPGGDEAYDLFLLAVCYAQLKDPLAAKACYGKAVAAQFKKRWTVEERRELAKLRAEAAVWVGE